MKTSEFDARMKIDKKLEEAGWIITDKSQVSTYGGDVSGGQDYLLKDRRGRALAVLEAKKEYEEPYAAKQQALEYAKKTNAEYIFLSNGEKVLFWDYKNNQDARPVSGFFSQRDLEKRLLLRESKVPLNYISLAETNDIAGWPFQQQALKSVDSVLSSGRRKILIEMATGTGKTRVAIAIAKRLLKSGQAQRVLFLVDRNELALQAESAFEKHLPEYSRYILKAGSNKQEKQITISTLQTMVNLYQDFTAGYFDIVISDECHRSIYGQWRVCLSHFDAIQVGLTATPGRNIDRNTYDFFDCSYQKPTVSYSIQAGIKEGYLASYHIYKASTGIVLRGLRHKNDDGAEEDYDVFDLEKRIIVPSTNKAWVQEFREKAGSEPGKTIVFAVTKRHAAQLAQLFNEAYPEHGGRMAEVITSDTLFADKLIVRFKKERYPQIAVSVGMLDTGFDCPEVMNVVMMRPTLSLVLYQQMRGRGSRKCEKIGKNAFILWDFVGNSDRFKDKSCDPHSLAAILIARLGSESPRHRPPNPRKPKVLADVSDSIEERAVIQVGPEGEPVDSQEYQDEFVFTIKKLLKDHPILERIKNGEKVDQKEIESLLVELNQPKYFFNEENLRSVYGQPLATMVEFIRNAVGAYAFPNKEELINRAFESYISSKNFIPEQTRFLRVLANRFITNGKKITWEDFERPDVKRAGGLPAAESLFGEDAIDKIMNDLNTLVYLGVVSNA